MLYVDNNRLSRKSHFKVGILCLCGGLIGMHKFYAERIVDACIMAVLFTFALLGLMIHPIVSGICLGLDILILAIDGLSIMMNAFEDAQGKIFSPENAVKDKEPIFGMLFSFTFIPTFVFLSELTILSLIPATILIFVGIIYLIKEDKYIKSI